MADDDTTTGRPPAAGPRVAVTTHRTADQYAAGGDQEVHVFLKVVATGLRAGAGGRAPERTEVVVIDCSGSMAHPTFRKIRAAQRAAAAAIDLLPDGTHFALVEGRENARVAYPWREPDRPGTTVAGAATRGEGSRTAHAMNAHGGTRISTWLDLTRRLLATRPDAAFRHVLLLTDGKDEHDAVGDLRRALDACEGVFSCDALGIGDDYDGDQLLEITSRLHGRAVAVAAPGGPDDPGDLAAGAIREQLAGLFREIVRESTARVLPELTVRVRTADYLAVTLFRQIYPTELDLTGSAERRGAAETAFPTGAWGDGTRWYEVRLRADPGHPGYRAARTGGETRVLFVGLEAAGAAVPDEEPVTVRWTDEPPPLTIPGAPEHLLRNGRLNEATRLGSRAFLRGDVAEAERQWGLAVRLAHELDDRQRLDRLATLVMIEDAAAGRVRVRDRPAPGDAHAAIIESTYTVAPPDNDDQAPEDSEDGEASEGSAVWCPVCERHVPPGTFCTLGGHPLPGGA